MCDNCRWKLLKILNGINSYFAKKKNKFLEECKSSLSLSINFHCKKKTWISKNIYKEEKMAGDKSLCVIIFEKICLITERIPALILWLRTLTMPTHKALFRTCLCVLYIYTYIKACKSRYLCCWGESTSRARWWRVRVTMRRRSVRASSFWKRTLQSSPHVRIKKLLLYISASFLRDRSH